MPRSRRANPLSASQVYGYGTSGGEIPEGYLDVTLPGGRPGNKALKYLGPYLAPIEAPI